MQRTKRSIAKAETGKDDKECTKICHSWARPQGNDAHGSLDRTEGSLLRHLCLSCDAVFLVTAGFADRASSAVWVEVILT